jgi:predicted porin
MSSLIFNSYRNFTMKKSLIALAVAATVATPMVASAVALQPAGDQDSINLYGSFRPQYLSTNAVERIADGGSRWGIKGSHDLGNGLSSFYRFERTFSTADASFPVGGRLAYAGLKGGFGSLSGGQQWSPYYTAVVSANDPFAVVGASNWYDNGNAQLNRVGNNLTYQLPSGMPFGGGIAVISDGDTLAGAAGVENSVDAIALGLTAAAGPVNLGFGYSNVGNQAVGLDDSKRVGLTANMDVGPANLGFMWENVDVADDAGSNSPWSVQASVMGFLIQYASTDEAIDDKAVAVQYTYKLSGNTRVQIAWEGRDDRDDDTAVLRYRVDF